jgi:nitroreductase
VYRGSVISSPAEVIGRRYSVRAYRDEPLTVADREGMVAFLKTNQTGPLGSRARFVLVAATGDSRAMLRGLGTYGVIRGAQAFLLGAVERGPHDLEDYGYLMECAVLRATEMGLGTCWLGGTFSRSAFAERIVLTPSETMPAVVALGYAAAGGKAKDPLRRIASSNDRLPGDRLFFDGGFDVPLSPGRAGVFGAALDAVRWAPSASNKQSWRVVRLGEDWHFFVRRGRTHRSPIRLSALAGIADLRRVDLGIAMCHFEAVARESGASGSWARDGGGAAMAGSATEYAFTWRSSA